MNQFFLAVSNCLWISANWSLRLSCMEFIELLGHVYSYLSSDLESMGPLFLQIIFLLLSLFLSWDFNNTYVGIFDSSTGPSRTIHFSSFFFLSATQTGSFVLSSSWLILSSACSNLLLNPSSVSVTYSIVVMCISTSTYH